MSDAAFSCMVSTIGLTLPFVLLDPGSVSGLPGAPISNAASVQAIVWVNQQGHRRALAYSNEISAVFTYTLSAQDTRSPHVETGYLEITFGGGTVVMTSHFTFNVTPHF